MNYSPLSHNPFPPGFDPGLAALIDHTLLKPEATHAQIKTLCLEALEYGFASVCVNPYWVPIAAQILGEASSLVKICTVIGFPLGATYTSAKVHETLVAIHNGANEVDMVINIGALKSCDYLLVGQEIEKVVQAAEGHALVKVILETCFLTDEEKIKACEICKTAGADFVKTSTGFGPGGATVADITLMRQTVGEGMGVKASGGVRDRQTALAMIQAGANRIGTSSGIQIVSTNSSTPASSDKLY